MRENHSEAAASADVMKRSTAARRDPLFTSLAHMRNANALARLHHPAESLRALALAEKNFARAGAAKRSAWIDFYTPAEFSALSSYIWSAMGQHDRAESCLHQTLSAIPEELTRNRALFTAHLSLVQAKQGELELACETARQASELLPPGSGSRRTANVLAAGRAHLLRSGSKAPEVVEWIEESGQWI
ncbi:hypothetical protein [Streptomyces sp. NPDC020607]|uniref:hypothetical protein n=1 Tax=Streptomyces sp. NPDC020607 TaxID=3365082 RepID=UPI0037ACE7DA